MRISCLSNADASWAFAKACPKSTSFFGALSSSGSVRALSMHDSSTSVIIRASICFTRSSMVSSLTSSRVGRSRAVDVYPAARTAVTGRAAVAARELLPRTDTVLIRIIPVGTRVGLRPMPAVRSVSWKSWSSRRLRVSSAGATSLKPAYSSSSSSTTIAVRGLASVPSRDAL
ncbi:unnamed protein product [Chrysodeixis includens]|uniref:Uncharacterized protein n=1 Tax=Chrysodeixis includens TaxID=689277 RepID=A0A9N8PYC3_CHRIL|nr:unnamed protein product [Chrysodeixis includens]